MTKIVGGVVVTGFISPSDTGDSYAVIDPIYGIDGLRNYSGDTSVLNSITTLRRRAGMFVGVNDGAQVYQLKPAPWNNTISDWNLLSFSGGSGSTIGPVSATESGIVNNIALQELGGVDKLIHGVRAGLGNNGAESVVFGINSQNLVTTGIENHAFGWEALASVTTGSFNTAMGWAALSANTTGNGNSAFGDGALWNNTVNNNSAFGGGALQSNTTGINNTAVGSGALFYNVSGSRSVAIGTSAGVYNTGTFNTFVGAYAGGGPSSFATNTGSQNVALGFQAGRALTTGSNNILIENITNDSVTTGSFNIIIDPRNKAGVQTGNNNVLIGGWDGVFGNISDTIALGTGGGVTKFLSDITGSFLPAQTIALIDADSTGRAIVTKEYLSAFSSTTYDDVVHKKFNETIIGVKTFSADTNHYGNILHHTGWYISDATSKMGLHRLPNNPDSAAALQVNGPIFTDDGGIEFATSNLTRNVFSQGAFDILRLRNVNVGEPSTLLDISARPGNPTSDIREATLSLTRGNDVNDAEFLDFYNNGYFTGSSIEVQFGIRIQKRGIGLFRPFIFDWNDGTTKTAGFIAEQSTGFTFFKAVEVAHLKVKNLSGGTSVNNLGIDVNGNVVVGVIGSGSTSGGTTLKYYAEPSAPAGTPPVVGASNSIVIGSGTQANDKDMLVFGNTAGNNSNNVSSSTFIGSYAGQDAKDSAFSNFIGNSAGNSALNSFSSNFIGENAGNGAVGASNSNFIGSLAGFSTSGSNYLNLMGYQAGYQAKNVINSNFIGNGVGNAATDLSDSNFIGSFAGQYATGASYSNFIGYNTGVNSNDSPYSNMIGYYAGYQTSGALISNYIGYFAGSSANNSQYSNFIGYNAGGDSYNSENSNFIGYQAGNAANDSRFSNFIGWNAGYGASASSFSTLIGYKVGYQVDTDYIGDNNIIIGTNISLPNGSTNRINIGGLLFGFDTYSDTSSDTSITQSGGRVGINQSVDNEIDTLQVGGTLNIGDVTGGGPSLNNLGIDATGRVVIGSGGGGGISNSSAIGTIPKTTSGGNLIDSMIRESGTTINIGQPTVIPPSATTVTFESGTLAPLTSISPIPWYTQTLVTNSGSTYAAKSGDITDNGNTKMTYVTSTQIGVTTFSCYYKVSSEFGWDFLKIYLNGSIKLSVSGEEDWTLFTFDLIPNSINTIDFIYNKDGSSASGSDSAYIDDIGVNYLGVDGLVGTVNVPTIYAETYLNLPPNDNFVRDLIINRNDLPFPTYNESDVCEYINNLPEPERTIAPIDSKWNVIIAIMGS